MARRTLREYSELYGNAGSMADKEQDENMPDNIDGQHIEENLCLDDQNLNESANIFSLLLPRCSDFLKSLRWTHLTIILIVFISIIFVYVFGIRRNITTDLQYETEDILKLLLPMSKKFISQQKSIWYQILTGFTNLIRPPISPAVYLLLSDEKSETTSSCVAEIITSVANKILPNNQKWLLLNGTKLSNAKSTDPGVLVESVAEKMQFSRVVVVSDIHKIPANLAAGFHFLVDQENPKIRDAVYVFTMTIEKIGSVTKPLDVVEKILYKSWKDLSGNILYPLVTRVTEAVLHIVQEEEIGVCQLKTGSTLEIKIP